MWLADTSADRSVPHHFMAVLNRALLRSALALACLTVPELGHGIVRIIAGLWLRCALAATVICVPILVRTALLALFALAFTVSVAPFHISRASAWVHALAVADLLIPHKANWIMLREADALASKNVEILSSRALGKRA